MIHRSLLFDAIEERRDQQLPLTEEENKKSLLGQILDALKASEEETHVTESTEHLVNKNEGEENGKMKALT